MRIIEYDRIRRILLGGAVFAIAFSVTGCGSQGARTATTPPTSTEMTTENLSSVMAIIDVLNRDEIAVVERSVDADPSQETINRALSSMSALYDLSTYNDEPSVYTLEIAASAETRLPPGKSVVLIHISGVPRDVSGPWQPTSDPSQLPSGGTAILQTDMFTFFDASSLEHLATIYIGPAQ